jgi:hypothetical protein
MKRYFPKVMWADVDIHAGRDAVVIYPTKGEQRGNRPDLIAIPVAVIPIDGRTEHELCAAVLEVGRKWAARKGGKVSR